MFQYFMLRANQNQHFNNTSKFPLTSSKQLIIKLFKISTAAQRDNSNFLLIARFDIRTTGFSIFGKVQRFLPFFRSHICLLVQTGNSMRREMPLVVLSFPGADLKSHYPARSCRRRLKSEFLLHPRPHLKPTAQHTFQTCYKIQLVNQLNAI